MFCHGCRSRRSGARGEIARPLDADPNERTQQSLPVSKIAQDIGCVMVAHPDLGTNTLPELLDLARRNPGKVSYGSYGIGSLPHVTMEALTRRGNLHTNRKEQIPPLPFAVPSGAPRQERFWWLQRQ
jgi:tripartite-type tricarboxylate transporter receptor subunit TctC